MPYSAPGPFLGAQTASAYQVSRSLRFRSSASAYLSRTPASNGDRQKFTWSGWVKRGTLTSGTYYALFAAGGAGANEGLFFDPTAGVYLTNDNGVTAIVTSAVLRDPSAWYHIVCAVDTTQATAANRQIIYFNGVKQTSYTGSYCAQNVNSSSINVSGVQQRIGAHTNAGFYFDGYLAEVNFIDGQALTPSSFGQSNALTGVWEPKAYAGSYGTNGFYLPFSDNTNANTLCYDRAGSNTVVSTAAYFTPTGGVSQSSLNLVGPLSQLYDGVTTGQTTMYNNPVNSILQVDAGSGNTLDLTKWGFYLRNATASETWSIQYSDDNSTWTNAKTGFQVSAAGWNDTTFTSVGAHRYWRAIVTTQVNGEYVTEYRLYGTGTYRTANDWTPNNISVATGTTYDSMLDSPTNAAGDIGNYAVWSPLVLFPNTTYQSTMSNANLLMTRSAGGQGGAVTTIGATSGKYYAEITVTAAGSSFPKVAVIADNNPPSINSANEYYPGGGTTSVAYRSDGGKTYNNSTTASWGSTYTTNDVIGIAFDADSGKVWFGKQTGGTGSMVWQASGDPAAGTNPANTLGTGVPFYFSAGGESGVQMSFNTGQRPLSATAPSGFSALNTQNLPAPALTPSP